MHQLHNQKHKKSIGVLGCPCSARCLLYRGYTQFITSPAFQCEKQVDFFDRRRTRQCFQAPSQTSSKTSRKTPPRDTPARHPLGTPLQDTLEGPHSQSPLARDPYATPTGTAPRDTSAEPPVCRVKNTSARHVRGAVRFQSEKQNGKRK